MKFISFLLACAFLWSSPAYAETECRIAFRAETQTAPLILAFKNSWLRAPDINFVPLDQENQVQITEALMKGDADMAVLDGLNAVKTISQKLPCVLLCAFQDSSKAYSLFASAKEKITKPDDMAGKRIGVDFQTAALQAISVFLEKHKLDPPAKLVDISADKSTQALKDGKIEALAYGEPEASALRSKKFKQISFLEDAPPMMLIASRKYALENPEALKGIIAGLLAATEELNDKPDKFSREVAEAIGTDPQVEKQALANMSWKIAMNQEVIEKLEKSAEFLKTAGQIDQIPDIRSMAPKKFIAE